MIWWLWARNQTTVTMTTPLTTLLKTARKCNVCLNYDKLQYKMQEGDFFGETYTINRHKPAQTKVFEITEMPPPTCKKQVQSLAWWMIFQSSQQHCQSLQNQSGSSLKKKYPLSGDQSIKMPTKLWKSRLLKHQY